MKFRIRQKKTFSNYRVKQVKLLREYSAYEKQFVGTLADEVKELQKQKAPDFLKGQDTLIENVGEYLELIAKSDELAEEIKMCKEVFLMENNCAKLKEICEIVYEDFTGLDEDLEYEELYKFAFETLDFFFESNNSIMNIGDSLKKNLLSKSQTQMTES